MRRKPNIADRRRQARIDRLWHSYQLAIDAPRLEMQRHSAVYNFAILDTMPKRARKLIDELGPEAPEWANEWFATGCDPGHRRKA